MQDHQQIGTLEELSGQWTFTLSQNKEYLAIPTGEQTIGIYDIHTL